MKPKFTCDKCSAKFKTIKQLKRHKDTVDHTKKGQKK